MNILIKNNGDKGYTINLHPDLANKLGIRLWKQSILRFGLKAIEIQIALSNDIEYGYLFLSNDIVDELVLPQECTFEMRVLSGELHIGPYIGILAADKEVDLIKRSKWMTNFVKEYDLIRGVIFSFSFESIDIENMMIEGYLYDPSAGEWRKMAMPFPGAIYINAILEKKQREYLRSLYGPKVFNYKNLSKWDIHEILVNSEEIAEFLPETCLYENPMQAITFFNNFDSVYIKPISGFGGKGIMKFSAYEQYFMLQYSEKENNIKLAFMDEQSLSSYLAVTFEKQKYIIQQGLELELINNRVCDFRIALNKNQNGKWKFSGIIARVGDENSIVSNYSSGGSVEPFETALMKYYNLKNDEVVKIKESIKLISNKILEILEESGQFFGKLAIDLGIDEKLNIWIIEVNNRSPNDFLFSHAGDRRTTFQIKLDNMLYAKWLSGFGINEH